MEGKKKYDFDERPKDPLEIMWKKATGEATCYLERKRTNSAEPEGGGKAHNVAHRREKEKKRGRKKSSNIKTQGGNDNGLRASGMCRIKTDPRKKRRRDRLTLKK